MRVGEPFLAPGNDLLDLQIRDRGKLTLDLGLHASPLRSIVNPSEHAKAAAKRQRDQHTAILADRSATALRGTSQLAYRPTGRIILATSTLVRRKRFGTSEV